ncbi:class E sortase [Kitasatospora sp. NPDC088783]|uniref:class E sortase n=1 Tax=Kitasatospora sp. NPDC088783 TaxID=3364077 RepID=UPI003820E27C
MSRPADAPTRPSSTTASDDSPRSGLAATSRHRWLRALGGTSVLLGLVIVAYLVHLLWWTNVEAEASAEHTLVELQQQWRDPSPGTSLRSSFSPGEGFAILHVPSIGITYPIAEGTGKKDVLDRGLVGHYGGTALPADPAGNFAVAAHRTTHGEPFRQLGKLKAGDLVVVETAETYFTYQVAGSIPETDPDDVSVLEPVPHGSPFTTSGRYLTMTTCTPEFSARGRLVVFGALVAQQPRAQGEPPALAGR